MGENVYTVLEENIHYVMKTILDELGEGNIEIVYVDQAEQKFLENFVKNENGEYEFTSEEITRFIYDLFVTDEDIDADLLKCDGLNLVVSPDGSISFEIKN